MPVTTQDIDRLRGQAESSASSATNFAAQSPSVESELRDALASKFTSYKEPIEQRSQAMAGYLSAPADARALYGDPESSGFVFNPYQRQKLISNAQAQAYQPYAALSDYINLGMGTVRDLASQGAGMYQTEANRQLGGAQLAQGQYDTALNEYLSMANLDLARQKQSADTAISPIEQLLLESLMGGQQGTGYGSTPPSFAPPANGVYWEQDDGSIWQYRDNQWFSVDESPTLYGQSNQSNQSKMPSGGGGSW